MMPLRLYAIALDDVRVIFHAPPDAAVALRAIARDQFAPDASAGKSAWFSRPSSRRLPADHPAADDIDTLLAGRFVRPERLVPSWRLIETWIAAMAWGCHRTGLDAAQIDAIDFDLAKAGVAPSLSLRSLVSRWDEPVRFAPGLVAGTAPGTQADAMLAAWTAVDEEVDDDHRDAVNGCREWFAQFPGWRDAAAAQHRPPPDLVAIFGG